jgi:hypothetical protein
MRAIAGAIMFLAAAVALAGGWISEALGKSNYGFGMLGVMAALVFGIIGTAVLLSDFTQSRRRE